MSEHPSQGLRVVCGLGRSGQSPGGTAKLQYLVQYRSDCPTREAGIIMCDMEPKPKMDYWPGYSLKGEPLPYTLRFCKVCRKETPHEIRSGAGLTAKMCMKCLADGRRYELDRD
jgi:hypothetical protein